MMNRCIKVCVLHPLPGDLLPFPVWSVVQEVVGVYL